METVEIGRAHIRYDRNGNVTHAEFSPVKHAFNVKDIEDLKTIRSDKDENTFKENATKVFSAWFTHLNDIELADREKYEITSKLHCKKRSDGTVYYCEIEFFFQQTKNQLP